MLSLPWTTRRSRGTIDGIQAALITDLTDKESGKTASGAKHRLKICLTCSHGGHLTEMLSLKAAFEGHDVFYFCYEADTTRALPNVYLVPNMARNPIEFAKNLFRVTRIFRSERPDLVVSTGAEIALPVFSVAKLFRLPTLYIECGAQVAHPSFTGRIMHWMADDFYVQWPELLKAYGPRAMLRGSLIDEDYPVQNDLSYERRMRVTLVQPAQVGSFSSDQPPMGLAYIAAILEQCGCVVRVVDANVERLSPHEVTAILVQQAPDMVCFTVTTPLYPGTMAIARRLKGLDRTPILVAGGAHATVLPDDFLEDGIFDYVVRGEGEHTMRELVQRLLDGRSIEDVEGLSWREDGEVRRNPDRALCPDIDTFPFPDWSLFPLKRYSSLARRHDLSLPITTSRGCPFGCTFCYKGIYGRRLRMRTPEKVVEEWAHLIHRYNIREVAVLDDVFTFDIERAIAICDMLVERGLNHVPWSTTNGIRVDRTSPELFAAMKRAGCYRVYFGVESGVQKVIDSLQKGISLEQVRKAIDMARRAGLEVGAYFMLGNVGETVADMEATIAFALELDLDYAQFSIATPYPGTQIFARIEREGKLLIRSWEELATYGRSVFEFGEVSPQSVGRMFRRAIRKFYFRPRYVLRQLRETLTWVGLRHRVLAALLLIRLAVSGGKRSAGSAPTPADGAVP